MSQEGGFFCPGCLKDANVEKMDDVALGGLFASKLKAGRSCLFWFAY